MNPTLSSSVNSKKLSTSHIAERKYSDHHVPLLLEGSENAGGGIELRSSHAVTGMMNGGATQMINGIKGTSTTKVVGADKKASRE